VSDGPRVDVLMAAYNTAPTVAAAMRSVLAQTVSELHLTVIDDGSADDTVAEIKGVAAADGRVTLIEAAHGGLARALNTGLAASSAPLVSFFDSDDLMLPEYLAAHLEALDGDPGAALAYGDAWVFDELIGLVRRTSSMGKWQPPASVLETSTATLERLVEGNFVFGEPTVRRAAIERAGGFDESLPRCEDYDLWVRLAAAGERFLRLDRRLAVVRDRAGSMSQDLSRVYAGVADVLERAARNPEVPPEVAGAALRRRERLPDELESLTPGGLRAAVRPLRNALKRRVLWHRRPPEPVRAAFPELDRP
jgi:glycosyltransferase involved in cell wall biosynthesis